MKPAFVALLAPIQRQLIARGVRPDHLTLVALPLQLGIALALVLGTFNALIWVAVPVIGFLLMAVNALDGSIARATGASTARGAVTNEFVDRTGDIMIFGAAFAISPSWIAGPTLAAVLATELCAAISWAVTGQRVFLGPMSKPDRMLVLGIAALAAIAWPQALIVGLIVIGLGSIVGVHNRTRAAFSLARSLDEQARS